MTTHKNPTLTHKTVEVIKRFSRFYWYQNCYVDAKYFSLIKFYLIFLCILKLQII